MPLGGPHWPPCGLLPGTSPVQAAVLLAVSVAISRARAHGSEQARLRREVHDDVAGPGEHDLREADRTVRGNFASLLSSVAVPNGVLLPHWPEV